MKKINMKNLGTYIVIIITTILLAGCTSKELSIRIDPKPTPNGYDMFYFIDEIGQKMPDFGGLAASIKGLKINGKEVYRAIIIDMMDAHNQKGIYFAFSEEQMPMRKYKGTDQYGQDIVETVYNGGTTLAAGSMHKFKYRKGINSLNIIVK